MTRRCVKCGIDADQLRDTIIVHLYADICLRAERNMAATGTVSGAHWNAMKAVLTERGLLDQAEAKLNQLRGANQ